MSNEDKWSDRASMTSATHQWAVDTEYIPDLQSYVILNVCAINCTLFKQQWDGQMKQQSNKHEDKQSICFWEYVAAKQPNMLAVTEVTYSRNRRNKTHLFLKNQK